MSTKKTTKVAVKTLRKGATGENRVEFLREAALMFSFRHPNIVSLVGVCLDNEPPFLIMELMEGGDLSTFLRNSRRHPPQSRQRLTMADLVAISRDVASGCAYMEKRRFVHR